MPSGEVHVKIWRAFFPLTFLVAILVALVFDWYTALFVFVGWGLHGFGIDNDLDLTGMNRSEALWTKFVIFIPLIGWSTLYARIFQKWGGHRSFWTHGFIASTFIRLMFFGFPFVYWFRIYFVDSLYREFLGMFIGLCVSDSIHTLADMVTGEVSFGKRFGFRSETLKYLMKIYFDYPPSRKR